MNVVKRWLRQLGVHVSRTPDNRFDAIGDTLSAMRARGFVPSVVVDGGANRGQFFRLARPVFPEAAFHLIEPQSACVAELRELAGRDRGNVAVHPTVVTEPGVRSVRMVGGGARGDGAGNWVAKPGDASQGESKANATTLDELLDGEVQQTDRVLLKLDLETHELPALKGASSLLTKVEAVLTEVSFYDADEWGAPLFAELVAFLEARDLALYEIASLSGRGRDGRLRMGDAVFVRRGSTLHRDVGWD